MKKETGDSPEVCLSPCELAASLRIPRGGVRSESSGRTEYTMKLKLINSEIAPAMQRESIGQQLRSSCPRSRRGERA